MRRRHFMGGLAGLGGGLGSGPGRAWADGPADPGFAGFLTGVRAEAERAGIPREMLDTALSGLSPDPEVLALMAHQPEFTLSWPVYARRALSPARVRQGRAAYGRLRPLWPVLARDFGVPPALLLGIWGLESNYGESCGDFPAIRSLATLAYGTARREFFRGELLAALEIIHRQGFAPAVLRGSYAGALGQPQFMPSSYLRYGVDFDQDGSCDIWHDEADVLASIANFLKSKGWDPALRWGARIASRQGAPVPEGAPAPLAVWRRAGIGEAARLGPAGAAARLVRPRGGEEVFLVTSNFDIIKAYNHSDFYALAVALLGERIIG